MNNFSEPDDLIRYVKCIIISFLFKFALDYIKKYYESKKININDKFKEDFPNTQPSPDNNGPLRIIDVFNSYSLQKNLENNIWSASVYFYNLQLIHADKSFKVSVVKKLFNLYLILEKYFPILFFINFCYCLAFTHNKYFIFIEMSLCLFIVLTFFICIFCFSIATNAYRQLSESTNVSESDVTKIKWAFVLIHSMIVIRSIGLFWKVVEIIKWIFRK